MEKVATPLLSGVVPSMAVPSEKVTFPVGVLPGPVTVAVNTADLTDRRWIGRGGERRRRVRL